MIGKWIYFGIFMLSVLAMSAYESKGQETAEGSDKRPSQEELKAKLTPLQYKVTQGEGTEPPFRNE